MFKGLRVRSHQLVLHHYGEEDGSKTAKESVLRFLLTLISYLIYVQMYIYIYIFF